MKFENIIIVEIGNSIIEEKIEITREQSTLSGIIFVALSSKTLHNIHMFHWTPTSV